MKQINFFSLKVSTIWQSNRCQIPQTQSYDIHTYIVVFRIEILLFSVTTPPEMSPPPTIRYFALKYDSLISYYVIKIIRLIWIFTIFYTILHFSYVQ